MIYFALNNIAVSSDGAWITGHVTSKSNRNQRTWQVMDCSCPLRSFHVIR